MLYQKINLSLELNMKCSTSVHHLGFTHSRTADCLKLLKLKMLTSSRKLRIYKFVDKVMTSRSSQKENSNPTLDFKVQRAESM